MTGKMTDCSKTLNMTFATYIRPIRQVCISIYNLVTVLLFVETSAMVEQNQNSRL
jgi:hypothetical protein